MAICDCCMHDMSDNKVDDCAGNRTVEYADGVRLPSVPYNPDYGDENQRCRDCNIKRGGHHHPGCDMERCPRCEGQLISCGCALLE